MNAPSISCQVIDREGQGHELSWPVQQSLMQSIRDSGLDVEAICGGCCACATCHVYVAESWRDTLGSAAGTELALLGATEHFDRAASRLSCQINHDPQLNGLLVTLAPEE